RDRHGVVIDPERVLLTAGGSPALLLALNSAFVPGDRVALARPGYPAYRNVLRALHMDVIEIPCGPEVRYQLTLNSIERLSPEPSGIIVSSPANPTGTLIDEGEFEAIAKLAADRGIGLISDEIYHGICYEQPARSALEFSDEAWVINSF